MARSDRERAEAAERRCMELERQLSQEHARKHSAQRALWYCLEALNNPGDPERRRDALAEISEVIP